MVVEHIKGSERFLFIYESGDEKIVLDTLSDMARDPLTGFDWFDAAALSHKVAQGLLAELKAYLPKVSQ